jgi:tRNA threonylcarbamoyl adenosine modification protein (Sua5/YciO/YrdC/YwlC family)
MKRYLPGPYTFILPSNNYVQKFFNNSRQEIGIRIPNNAIAQGLLSFLDVPLISASLRADDEIRLFHTDPDEIEMEFQNKVDILADGGLGDSEGSTILDCTGSDIELIRQGKGPIDI